MDSAGSPSWPRGSIDELDALLEDPERWALVDADKLRHLLFYRCLSYGIQPDEAAIPQLMSLHKVGVERLHPAVRRQVVVHLARAVERLHREHQLHEGAGCTNALLPFLLEDPDPSVVSTAATEMALLLPLEEADPLTGPRYVRSLADEVSGDDARAGLIAGLLQLGDLRIRPFVQDAWKALGHEARQTLALLIQAFHGVSALTVEFLLAWLEDEAKDAGGAGFGVVAATLARAGRNAAEYGVADVRRVFPVSDAPDEEPFEAEQRFDRDDFAPTIRERLRRITAAERPPDLMTHVLSYWGFERDAYRAAVTAGIAAADRAAAVDPPLRLDLVPDWPEEPEVETLLEWGIFNPLGPSINTIRLTPAEGVRALVYTLYHPTGSASRLVAVLPDTGDPAGILAAVTSALSRNGDGGVWMLRSLPDYVHLPAGSPVDKPVVAACLAAARAAAIADGDEDLDLVWHADRLRRLADDPWATTGLEIEEASAGDRRKDRVVPRRASRADGAEEEEAREPPAAEEYLPWLEVASSPAHVAAVRRQLPRAWQRAVERAVDRDAG